MRVYIPGAERILNIMIRELSMTMSMSMPMPMSISFCCNSPLFLLRIHEVGSNDTDHIYIFL
jgi:hypothetical protein